MDNYVGKRLDGRYEIREIIGVGGMAIVYKAYDNIDDRLVAIKILKDEFLANEEFRRRFKNESKAIAVLSHPNIVNVYDVSFGEKLQYIVMEYVEGITLKEYIGQQKVLEWPEAVHFTTQILRALQHAHDKGIVHRDIKPQNIILLENGTIKVTDFGIARFSRSVTLTMTEAAIGSVHYISPEQARGDMTDNKADIYSVGVVLYEMITGKVPFESDSAVSVALKQLQEEAVPPRQVNPAIPIGLEQIVLHSMEKSPRDRYQSAAEMLLDLDELKRNPSVKFDYSYYVDPEPTKFIPKSAITGVAPDEPEDLDATRMAPADLSSVPAPKPKKSTPKQADRVKPKSSRKKLGRPVWMGIIIGASAAALLAVLFLGFYTGIFTGNRVIVPDFVGLNYYTDVLGNEKYSDFNFETTFVTSTSDEVGTIKQQDKDPDSKVRRGSTIKLEIASNGMTATIPDINGKTLVEAQNALKEAGFQHFNVVTQSDSKAAPNTVIRSDPPEGTKMDTSETIILYVSADADNKAVTVPDFSGMNYYSDKDHIIDYIESTGLKLGSTSEKDSSEPKGTIIAQSLPKNSTVKKGTSVDLVISSGASAKHAGTVTITLPDTNAEGTYRLYVGNELYKTSSVICNGASYSINVTGTGSNVSIVAYVDNYKLYEGTADFTQDPVTFSNVHRYRVATASSGFMTGNP